MQDHLHAFIVRLWGEATDHEGQVTVWRGSVEEVGSRQRFYFVDLQQACQFIRDKIGMTSTDSTRSTTDVGDGGEE